MSAITIFAILGFVLIVIELFVFSFSVFWAFIVGVSALITALSIYIFPQISNNAIESFILISVLNSMLLYIPLKKFVYKNKSNHTMLGKTAMAITDINNTDGKVRWSGTIFAAKTNNTNSIKKGALVKIIKVEDINLIVDKK